MDAQFEEKQYEFLLNQELADRPNLVYPSGQMIENTVGVDSALFSRNRWFWRQFPRHRRLRYLGIARSGVVLNPSWWATLDDDIEYFPQMRFNVFLQHKRPEYCNSWRYGQWSTWNGSYYRYSIVPHQQEALEYLSTQVGNDGIVTYACAAFHETTQLWRHARKKTLVKSSNFAEAGRLSQHGGYSFAHPGPFGEGHSAPTPIESRDFEATLRRLSENRIETTPSTNQEFLLRVGAMIDGAMEISDRTSSPYNTILS